MMSLLHHFPGRLGRAKAEYLLDKKPVGSYLVRLSVKTWGYTISVKSKSFSQVTLAFNSHSLLALSIYAQLLQQSDNPHLKWCVAHVTLHLPF